MLRYSVDEKMSETKKLKPGPKRKLSDSTRKRNKKAANAKLSKNRVYIGDEYDRWMEIKTAFRLETNSEVANIIFVSIYIPLFSIQSTIKNNFPLRNVKQESLYLENKYISPSMI
jgi:hypothetical protein